MIRINGTERHVIGYLKDFLIAPDRARSSVRILSGGEKNRLLLARLFARPSNVLVLDEPTNDLDVETLELLEKQLLDYSGTILLVSNDREFLNNVVTSTLVFEPGVLSGNMQEGMTTGSASGPSRQIQRNPAGPARPKNPKPKKGGQERTLPESSPSKRERNWRTFRRVSKAWSRSRNASMK